MVKRAFTVRIEKELHDILEQRALELGISKTKLVEELLANAVNYKLRDSYLTKLEELQKKIEELEKKLEQR